MTDYRTDLKHDMERMGPARFTFDDVTRRRDSKHRNQRVTAGVVGLAVFVVAILIVASVKSLDRSETTVVPAASGTTGPTETTPTPTPTTADDAGWDGYGIPPEGTALSSPVEGQPILEQSAEGEILLGERVTCGTDCPNWYHTFLIVYADGRVLWWNDLRRLEPEGNLGGGNFVMERRLTPEGVDLVRSGVEPGNADDYGDLPDSAWADATARPYAPPRYAVCFRANGEDDPSSHPMHAAVDLLPASATALLDGSDPDPLHPGCLVVSTEAARAFSEILSDVGLDPAADLGAVTPGATVGSWLLRDAEPILGEPVGIYLHPLWPDGDWHHLYGA
jgi:hypothetical protein